MNSSEYETGFPSLQGWKLQFILVLFEYSVGWTLFVSINVSASCGLALLTNLRAHNTYSNVMNRPRSLWNKLVTHKPTKHPRKIGSDVIGNLFFGGETCMYNKHRIKFHLSVNRIVGEWRLNYYTKRGVSDAFKSPFSDLSINWMTGTF